MLDYTIRIITTTVSVRENAYVRISAGKHVNVSFRRSFSHKIRYSDLDRVSGSLVDALGLGMYLTSNHL